MRFVFLVLNGDEIQKLFKVKIKFIYFLKLYSKGWGGASRMVSYTSYIEIICTVKFGKMFIDFCQMNSKRFALKVHQKYNFYF